MLFTYDEVNKVLSNYHSGQFIFTNRGILRELGINPTLVLSELLSRLSYHAEKNELAKDGTFFCTTEKLEELTTLKYKAQSKAISTLENKGLIKVFNKKGNMRYFLLVLDKISALIESFSIPVKQEEAEKENKESKKEKEPNKIAANTPPKENVPEGNSRNDQKEIPEVPKRKNHYKKDLYKTPNKNPNNINSSSSSSKKVKEEEGMIQMNNLYRFTLEDFLTEKGFSQLLIKQTIKEFSQRGIRKFKVAQLESAFETMDYHHKNISPIACPHIFFANGVSMSLPQTRSS